MVGATVPKTCDIDCDLKADVAAMKPLVQEIHESIISEKAARQARQELLDKRTKDLNMTLRIGTFGILVIGALWAFFNILTH